MANYMHIWKCDKRFNGRLSSQQILICLLPQLAASYTLCMQLLKGFKCSYSPETPNLGQIRRFLEPCDLEIWRMTFKNNRAPLLCYFNLCAAFHSHWWIQTGVTVRKRPIWVKFDDFQRRVTLKFDGWPWKTIGHLSLATSSYMYHFIMICEFKLELQSGNG